VSIFFRFSRRVFLMSFAIFADGYLALKKQMEAAEDQLRNSQRTSAALALYFRLFIFASSSHLRHVWHRIFRERQALANELNAVQNPIIMLDVGGQRFHTTTVSVMNHGTHFLSTMFGGVFAVDAQQEEDGTVFVDRDPGLFPYVLAYLRDGAGSAWVAPRDHVAVQREFVFFSLAAVPLHQPLFDVLEGPIMLSTVGERYVGSSGSPLTGRCSRGWLRGTYILTLRAACPCPHLSFRLHTANAPVPVDVRGDDKWRHLALELSVMDGTVDTPTFLMFYRLSPDPGEWPTGTHITFTIHYQAETGRVAVRFAWPDASMEEEVFVGEWPPPLFPAFLNSEGPADLEILSFRHSFH